MSANQVIEIFYNIVFFFANFGFLGPLIIFGICCVDKRIFLNVLIVCLLNAFINAYLKALWQVPLHPSIGHDGFAFPSGHTQFNILVWFMILYYFRKLWIAFIAATICISSYFGMIHFNYHVWADIFAGIFFGALMFLDFVVWDKLFKNKQLELACIGLIISFVVLITIPYGLHTHKQLLAHLGTSMAILIYLILERFKVVQIVSKLDLANLLKFAFILVCVFIIRYINTNDLWISYLQGFAFSAITLFVASLGKRKI